LITDKALTTKDLTSPILLFNDECAVCRVIARWVKRSAERTGEQPSLIVRPIGDDPEILSTLNPDLDIWDAYANIHLLMPDKSMKTNGEAVAETLRRLSNTRWLARSFSVRIFGLRPFQFLLNSAYSVLSDVRPLLGCESCGIPPPWLRPFHWIFQRIKIIFKTRNHGNTVPHLTARPASRFTGGSKVP
jgi:predicted DCC family thiol-disulfide oxidoreductase YuxK